MNKGFFETTIKTKPVNKKLGCLYCKLDRTCKSPKLDVRGEGKKRILIVTDAPNKMEDIRGEYLLGSEGKFLKDQLKEQGIIEKDYWIIGAVRCRAIKNNKDRVPTNKEIQHCREYLLKTIKELKPKIIILLGDIPIYSFIASKWKKKLGTINKWRGYAIPDREAQAWILPIFHPSKVIEAEKSPVTKVVWKQDIQNIVRYIKKPFPKFRDEKKEVIITKDTKDIIRQIRKTIKEAPKLLSFDYETTGLKPHKEGHDIVCCSYTTENGTISFPINKKVKPYLKKLLESKVPKTAHNLKFENLWSLVRVDAKVKNWKWCSQTASHVLDGRGGISGLKFQTYLHFGIADYDSNMESFIKGDDDKDSNSFNRMKEAPLDEVLLYCGLDSLFGYRLTLLQMKAVEKEGVSRAYTLFHKGLLVFAKMEHTGFLVNKKYCQIQHNRLLREAEKLEDELKQTKGYKLWIKQYGSKLNMGSTQQLADILFNHLKLKPIKVTPAGNASVDEEVLEKLANKTTLVKNMIAIRKIKKMISTYFGGLIRETVDGTLHPFFHLNMTKSYRSSSSNINFQNIPIRNKKANRLIRSAIVPRKGNQLLEVDFKGIEVCVGACIHKDPMMIKYIKDPTTDMHRDMAMEIYKLKEKEVHKDTRYSAKNGFVFPQFYGDWYESCAKSLWENIKSLQLKIKDTDISLRTHLANCNINNSKQFTFHLKKVETHFWEDRFKVYNRWRKNLWREYQQTGIVELITGFRCKGVMGKNEVLNRPIQGVAFHILLLTLIAVEKEKRKRGWKSLIIGQVHDSIVMDIVPDELKEIVAFLEHFTRIELPKIWDWIIIPMQVDYELAPVDKPWYFKKEIDIKTIIKYI